MVHTPADGRWRMRKESMVRAKINRKLFEFNSDCDSALIGGNFTPELYLAAMVQEVTRESQ